MLPGVLARAGSDATRVDGSSLDGGTRRTARDWAVDAALFAFAVVVGAGEFWFVVVGNWFGLPLWIRVGDLVLGGLLCVALWWRRRAPVALGIAAATAAGVSDTAAGALFVLVFSLAVHRGWTRAVPVACATVVLGIPYIVLYFPGVIGDPLVALLLIALALAVAVSAGLAVRARRQLVLSLRQRADAERAEHERRLAETRLQERARIAREMHDVLAHRISLLSVHAGALEYRTAMAESGQAPAPTAAEVHQAVSVVRSNAHRALEELQDVLRVLREPGTAPVGTDRPPPTADRLPHLLAEARAGGQDVDIEPGIDDALAGLPPLLQRTVYRIVQEGLTNARKHAPGTRVRVGVTRGDAVEVLLENAVPVGMTGTEIPGARAGLTGVAERVVQHGGTLATGIADGRFRLHASLPA